MTTEKQPAKKYVANVILSDPTAVTAKLATMGSLYNNGGIFVTCPELGFEGINWLYCRYGLSIPYYKVQIGDTVLIEPTIEEYERWFYTGLADCGGATVTSADDVSITSTLQEIYMTLVGTMHLSSRTAVEAFVKGTTLQAALATLATELIALTTVFNSHTHVYSPGPSPPVPTAPPVGQQTPPTAITGITSTKIFGE
jgi:hypothetical protein